MGHVQRWIDRAAIGLSGLCMIHCVATVLLVAALASTSTILVEPAFHEIGLAVAIALAAVGLGLGLRRHGRTGPLLVGSSGIGLMAAGLAVPHGPWEAALTIGGVALVALAHRLNGRAFHRHAG